MPEERTRDPPHPSSTRASRGSPPPGGLSSILLESDLKASLAGSRSRPDAARGIRKARQHSDARRFLPDYGWSLPDHAVLHRTRRRGRATAASTPADLAESASSPP